MAKRRGKAKQRSSRGERAKRGRVSDPRGISSEGRVGPEWAPLGFNPEEPVSLVVVEPIRLADGRELNFDAPSVVPLYLFKAKHLRDAAEPKRKATLTQTTRAPTGEVAPQNAARTFDAMEELAVVVMLALARLKHMPTTRSLVFPTIHSWRFR